MPAPLTSEIETAARQIGVDTAQAYIGQDPFEVAERLALRVDWVDDDHVVAGLRLRAEYDHNARRIVLYRREQIAELAASEVGGRCEGIAVAHEIFHHLATTAHAINSALDSLSRRHRLNIEEIAACVFADEWLRLP